MVTLRGGIALVLLSISLTSCQAESDIADDEGTFGLTPLERERNAGLALSQLVLDDERRFACSPPPSEDRPSATIALRATHCYSCVSVGFLLRDHKRQAPDDPIWIATPAQDTTSVCRFLARERIELPVVVIDPLPRLEGMPAIYVVFRQDGIPRHIERLGPGFRALTGPLLKRKLPGRK